ncbi:MAG: hypothetical protein AAF944_19045 [Bacteroidota bacterium]
MELTAAERRHQLKATLADLEKLHFSESSYLALKQSGEMDEFIRANEQGVVDFAQALLQSILEQEESYAVLNRAPAADSDMCPLYVEFLDDLSAESIPEVDYIVSKPFVLDRPGPLALYLLGLVSGVVCLVIGAYTIFQALLD